MINTQQWKFPPKKIKRRDNVKNWVKEQRREGNYCSGSTNRKKIKLGIMTNNKIKD